MGTGTELGRVRGLGSAKHGAHHWLMQRLTAVGNFGLLAWLLTSFLALPMTDYTTVVGWMRSPLVAVPLMLLVISIFWHLRLGLQVLIEDYLHEDGTKLIVLVLLTFFAVAGAAFGLFSIAKIAFTGVAG